MTAHKPSGACTRSQAPAPPIEPRAELQRERCAELQSKRCALCRPAVVMLLAVLAAWVQTAPVAHAQDAAAVAADLRMAAEEQPFRSAAERFMARAAANDLGACEALLSPALRQRVGQEAVRRALSGQILPFFAGGGQPVRGVVVTRTTDAAGQQGFAFYMWWQPGTGGAPRPFTVYTVLEGGVPVLANVVPDRLVPGRHP